LKLYHTRFCAHVYSKMFSYNLYKNILFTRFGLQIYICVLYKSMFKTIFIKIKIPFYFLFKILIFDLSQSTERSTGPMTGLAGRPSQSTVALAVHISVCTLYRSTDRSTDCKQPCSRLDWVDRAVDRWPATVKYLNVRSTDRSTDRSVEQ